MDKNTEMLLEIGGSLATLALKGTVSKINTKIKTIKNEKNVETVKNQYDEIVNELISEREDAIRIAQLYKSEIEKIEISDTDINHLQNTITSILGIIKEMSPDANVETYELFKTLLNADTLKAMQLLGFNYKSAIGEPLTEACANAISSKFKTSPIKNNNQKNK